GTVDPVIGSGQLQRLDDVAYGGRVHIGRSHQQGTGRHQPALLYDCAARVDDHQTVIGYLQGVGAGNHQEDHADKKQQEQQPACQFDEEVENPTNEVKKA